MIKRIAVLSYIEDPKKITDISELRELIVSKTCTQDGFEFYSDTESYIAGSKLICNGKVVPTEDSLVFTGSNWDGSKLARCLRLLGYKVDPPDYLQNSFFDYKDRLFPMLNGMEIKTIEWTSLKPFRVYPQFQFDTSGKFKTITESSTNNDEHCFGKIPSDCLKLIICSYLNIPTMGFVAYEVNGETKFYIGALQWKNENYDNAMTNSMTIALDYKKKQELENLLDGYDFTEVFKEAQITLNKINSELDPVRLMMTAYYSKTRGILVQNLEVDLYPEFYGTCIFKKIILMNIWNQVKHLFEVSK